VEGMGMGVRHGGGCAMAYGGILGWGGGIGGMGGCVGGGRDVGRDSILRRKRGVVMRWFTVVIIYSEWYTTYVASFVMLVVGCMSLLLVYV